MGGVLCCRERRRKAFKTIDTRRDSTRLLILRSSVMSLPSALAAARWTGFHRRLQYEPTHTHDVGFLFDILLSRSVVAAIRAQYFDAISKEVVHLIEETEVVTGVVQE